MICPFCNEKETYSDWGRCKDCCHDQYIESVIEGITHDKQPHSAIKHILNVLWDNAYMAGRSSIAFDPSLSLGISKLTKDSFKFKNR